MLQISNNQTLIQQNFGHVDLIIAIIMQLS